MQRLAIDIKYQHDDGMSFFHSASVWIDDEQPVGEAVAGKVAEYLDGKQDVQNLSVEYHCPGQARTPIKLYP